MSREEKDEIKVEYEIKTKPRYDIISYFANGVAMAKDRYRKWCLIDKKGDKITKEGYDDLGYLGDGIYCVEKNGKKGIIDKEGNQILDCNYLKIVKKSGVIAVEVEEDKWSVFDVEKSQLKTINYREIESAGSKGLAKACKYDNKKGWTYVIVNKAGEQVTKKEYGEIGEFSEGMAVVVDGEKYGYIDESGEEVIKCQFEGAYDFHEGYAEVSNPNGYINKNGEMMGARIYALEASCGHKISEGLIAISQGSFHGGPPQNWYVDIKGNVVIKDITSNPWDLKKTRNFHEDRAAVEIGDKWGFIDKSGKVVIECKYDEVKDFKKGYAQVKIGDKWGIIDKNGEQTAKCEFDWFEEVEEYDHLLIGTKRKSKCLINCSRKELSAYYKEIRDFSEGMAMATKTDDSKVFIDETGAEVLILPRNTKCQGYFVNGLANCEKYAGKDGNVYIDKTGKIIIDFSELKVYEARIQIGENQKVFVADTEGELKGKVAGYFANIKDRITALFSELSGGANTQAVSAGEANSGYGGK